ncbi:MAG: hypothetical protein ABEJ28_09110 [Salinigranum sp.]
MANEIGWFGWFSIVGFVALGALALVDWFGVAPWPFSATGTAVVAVVAGIGAVLLYVGDDPTASDADVELTEAT